jgi:hypothetical protein
LSLDAGTANLNSFVEMREIFKDKKDIIFPVIFTKLESGRRNAEKEIKNNGLLEGLSPEDRKQRIIGGT